MWPIMFDTLTAGAAVWFCCLAVKLIDDFLDKETDAGCGRLNWAVRLGPGAMVYAVLALALAACINAPLSLSLFFASYAIGMYNDLGAVLPSRLTGWQESLLVLVLAVLLVNFHTVFFALLFVAAVQFFDDFIDMRSDRLCGQRNLACRLGPIACLICGLILLSAAWRLDENLFIPVFSGTAIFYFMALHLAGRMTA